MPRLCLKWNLEDEKWWKATLPGEHYLVVRVPQAHTEQFQIAAFGRVLKRKEHTLFKAQLYAEEYARNTARLFLRALEPLHLDEPPWEPPKSQVLQESVDEM